MCNKFHNFFLFRKEKLSFFLCKEIFSFLINKNQALRAKIFNKVFCKKYELFLDMLI